MKTREFLGTTLSQQVSEAAKSLQFNTAPLLHSKLLHVCNQCPSHGRKAAFLLIYVFIWCITAYLQEQTSHFSYIITFRCSFNFTVTQTHAFLLRLYRVSATKPGAFSRKYYILKIQFLI